jgi:hypothetical protein
MRYISLPAIDKKVSLKNYIAGIKMAKANPETVFKHGLTCWWSCTGADIMRQFLSGIQDRINQAIPYIDRN